MENYDAILRQILGDRTIAQFASLLLDERKAIFRQHLVYSMPVVIEKGDDADGGDPDPDMDFRPLLRQECFISDGEIGKQLAKEAREIYYGENQFNVRLHWLREFTSTSFGGPGTKIFIAPLIRGAITVVADLHDLSNNHCTYESESDSEEVKDGKEDKDSVHYRHGIGKQARWTQKRLQDLFLFGNAKQVTLVLRGRGLLDGSDLATHQTIKDISYVVKRLIDRFGDQFTIRKMLDRGGYPSRSLRSYWEAPKELARQRVRQGEATFEQVIQVEMEEWTRVFPRIIGPWMSREILA